MAGVLPARGPGRPPGSQNKTTVTVKAALQSVYDKRGGDKGLLAWSMENPDEFYKLWGRMLPTEVSGPDGGPVEVGLIERIIRRPQN